MGYSPVDLPKAKDDREGWQESVRDICVDGAMMMMITFFINGI